MYNLLGQEVTALLWQRQDAGEYKVKWDLTSDQGKRLRKGVYLVQLQAGSQVRHIKIVVQ